MKPGVRMKTKNVARRVIMLVWLTLLMGSHRPNPAQSEELIRHAVFIAGPTFTGILDEQGHAAWDSGRPGARDGFVLENDNVLIAWTDTVQEIKRADHAVVFEYKKAAENQEIGTAVRLADGHTLITELGKLPRILEVDAAGKVAKSSPLQPETDNAQGLSL